MDWLLAIDYLAQLDDVAQRPLTDSLQEKQIALACSCVLCVRVNDIFCCLVSG